MKKLQAFDVFHPIEDDTWDWNEYREPYDTVFFTANHKIDPSEVKRSLVDHDGYPPDIIVYRAK